MSKNIIKKSCAVPLILIPLALTSFNVFAEDYPIVQILKRNAASFAIDGNAGGNNGQDVYLWSENENNVNQQWYEIDRGDGYFSYQKVDTDYCLDGNKGGDNGQNVYLWTCMTNNKNQHWLKVNVGGDYYRLEKRNAAGYSIDGNSSGSNGQSVYLWSSDDSNQNQHWKFNYVSDGTTNESDCELSWRNDDIIINHETVNQTLEAVDISCVNDATISMSVQGVGPMENSDYLNVYYSIDGGTPIAMSTDTNAFNQKTLSASGINGNTVEIIIDGYTSYADETYTISDIQVVDSDGNTPDIPDPDTNPTGPDSSWTFCSNEKSYCDFSGIKELAYGVTGNWSTSIEVNGVDCNNTKLEDPKPGTSKSCWIRNPEDNYISVSNIDQLKSAMSNSNQNIRMERGIYVADELLSDNTSVFRFDGSNNLLDMTGVTLQVPTKLLNSMSTTPIHSQVTYDLLGDNITIRNGTFENTYPNGQNDVSDFEAHNNDPDYWPARQMTEFRIWGDHTELLGCTITVRGSYPYGYGDMFGKGSGSAVYLRKHAGIQISGDNVLIDGVNLSVLAFGHGIFMQGADNTTIRNSVVQGRMRLGADMYNDGSDSLPARFDYEQQYPDYYLGQAIDKTRMYNLTEDGIRAYTQGTKLDGSVVKTGAITVEDTKVINMRGCITTPLASKPSYIKNVEIKGCSIGYALANNSDVINSKGDAAYGPLYHSTYDTRSNTNVEITVTNIPSTGSHPLAYIAGSGHEIIFHSDGSIADIAREIRVGDTGVRWAGDASYQDASDIILVNETDLPVVLTSTSKNITVSSEGKVTDNGSNNNVN